MNKEIGKWFLDVAKYIVTAFILTNMFVKVDTVMSVVGAILIMVLLFGIGVFFLKRTPKKAKNSKIEHLF